MKYYDKFNSKVRNANEVDVNISKILNVKLDKIKLFQNEVFQDLDEEKFGISWWKEDEQLDFARKILLADQLLLSLNAIETNLIEGGIHKEEIFEYWDIESDSNKFDILRDDEGRPFLQHKGDMSLKDYLIVYKASMSVRSFFTSLTGSFDCLATVIVIVMGVRLDIGRVTYNNLKAHLREKFAYANETQKNLLSILNSFEDESGPNNWMKWIQDFRNMSVHKGRRLNVGQIEIIGKDINGKVLTKTNRFFSRNPALSEVESWKDQTMDLLNEDGVTTVQHSISSASHFLNLVINYLSEIWLKRKENPQLIIQPGKDQWKKINFTKDNNFLGFDSKEEINISSISMNSRGIKRMKAASVSDRDIHNWKPYKS